MGGLFFVDTNETAPLHFIGRSERTIARIANEIFIANGFLIRANQVKATGQAIANKVHFGAFHLFVSLVTHTVGGLIQCIEVRSWKVYRTSVQQPRLHSG